MKIRQANWWLNVQSRINPGNPHADGSPLVINLVFQLNFASTEV